MPRGFTRECRALSIGNVDVEVKALVENYSPAQIYYDEHDCPAEGGQVELEAVLLGLENILPRLNASWREKLRKEMECEIEYD